jgi:hypothetical protein
MIDMHREKEEMEFSNMDARHMQFIPYQCFDMVLDKDEDIVTFKTFLIKMNYPIAFVLFIRLIWLFLMPFFAVKATCTI